MKEDTKIVRAGRYPEKYEGAVNPPVYHASTILRWMRWKRRSTPRAR